MPALPAVPVRLTKVSKLEARSAKPKPVEPTKVSKRKVGDKSLDSASNNHVTLNLTELSATVDSEARCFAPKGVSS